MTPCNKIKREILRSVLESDYLTTEEKQPFSVPLDTDEQVDAAYDKLIDADLHWDYECEFRQGEVETNIPSEYSRHYESKSVAMKIDDGSWIGWTYWYGGGKHGEPEAIDWMQDAYELDCVEEEKLVVVRTFTRK